MEANDLATDRSREAALIENGFFGSAHEAAQIVR